MPSQGFAAMRYGKGYSPDYKTKDKDLVFPEPYVIEPEPTSEPKGEVVEAIEHHEPDRRPKGLPRAHGERWSDDTLPPAPPGWSPKQDLRRPKVRR